MLKWGVNEKIHKEKVAFIGRKPREIILYVLSL